MAPFPSLTLLSQWNKGIGGDKMRWRIGWWEEEPQAWEGKVLSSRGCVGENP